MKKIWNWLVLVYLFAAVVLIILGFSRALSLPVMIAAAVILLAIPLVREFMHRKGVDERQVQISRFSSSMGFYAYLALLLTIVIKDYLSKNQQPGDAFMALLVIPLVVKMFISLLQNFDPKQAARSIALFFSGIWLLFVVMSHGLSLETLIEGAPFLLLVGLAWAIKKYPKICGVTFIVLGLAFGVTFVRMQKNLYSGLLIFAALSLPMILSGLTLIFPREKSDWMG